MALLIMDGFDAGDPTLKGWTGVTGTGDVSPNTRFGTGRWVLRQSNGSQLALAKNLGANITGTVYAGCAIAHSGVTLSNGPVLFLCGDNGSTIHLQLRLFSNILRLYRGGTEIASSTISYSSYTFTYIEMAALIDDASGSVIVRQNGVELINFSGDTRNGGTTVGIDVLGFGCNTAGSSYVYVDDVYVCDTTGSAPNNAFLGDVRVATLVPSAVGNTTQFTATGDNYTHVDELPYSATDYVSGAGTGTKDTYAMADLPTGATTIYGLQTNVIAKKSDAGNMSLAPVLRSGVADYVGTATALGSSDLSLRSLHETDPATSTAWTESGVNSHEAGMEVA